MQNHQGHSRNPTELDLNQTPSAFPVTDETYPGVFEGSDYTQSQQKDMIKFVNDYN